MLFAHAGLAQEDGPEPASNVVPQVVEVLHCTLDVASSEFDAVVCWARPLADDLIQRMHSFFRGVQERVLATLAEPEPDYHQC